VQLPKLREPGKLRPWLYAIARNEALRCIRQRQREHASDELPEAASGEAGPDTVAARRELADVIAEAAGGLSERDRSVLELAYRHGLDGPELAEALSVSPGYANKMVSRLRQTVEGSLGALLVARWARHNPDGCPQLGAILAGWDGRFSVLMRKRIARHIESCSTCDEERRRLVNPVALLGGAPVFIPAPAWLRGHTVNQIQLTAATAGITGTTVHPAGHQARVLGDGSDSADARLARRWIGPIALFAATLIACVALAFVWLHHQSTPIAPAIHPTDLKMTAPQSKPASPIPPAATPNSPPPPTGTSTTVPVVTEPPIQEAPTTERANPTAPTQAGTVDTPTVPLPSAPPPSPVPTPVWVPPVWPLPPSSHPPEPGPTPTYRTPPPPPPVIPSQINVAPPSSAPQQNLH
jgi:RNA polymerase sigma factor (sigma-70 family)